MYCSFKILKFSKVTSHREQATARGHDWRDLNLSLHSLFMAMNWTCAVSCWAGGSGEAKWRPPPQRCWVDQLWGQMSAQQINSWTFSVLMRRPPSPSQTYEAPEKETIWGFYLLSLLSNWTLGKWGAEFKLCHCLRLSLRMMRLMLKAFNSDHYTRNTQWILSVLITVKKKDTFWLWLVHSSDQQQDSVPQPGSWFSWLWKNKTSRAAAVCFF